MNKKIKINIIISFVLFFLFGSSYSVSDIAGNVTQERALKPDENHKNWLLYGRDFGQQHYSPLKQINSKNVSDLGLAWSTDVASSDGLIATPIIVDNVIYISGSFSQVFAFDVKTGKGIDAPAEQPIQVYSVTVE